MNRPARALTVFIILLAWAGLSGCQVFAGEVGNSEAERDRQPPGEVSAGSTRTPFLPAAPTIQEETLPTVTANEAQQPETIPSALPEATVTAAVAAVEKCDERAGRIEEKEAAFTPEAPLRFRVYLPPCFDSGEGAPYPVLYMIHGQTFADDQWPRLGIAEAADALIAGQGAQPFLIVMPREDNTFADIYLSAFSTDVIEGLIPWVDENYPTCARRECRAIGGLSRGGAWALHLGFIHWELFGAIGAHSTPPFNTTPRQFPGWVQQIPPGALPRVYMDIGRGDPYLSMASAFEEQLTGAGVPHDWYLFNGTHDEEYWSAHTGDYLAWYAANWANLSQP